MLATLLLSQRQQASGLILLLKDEQRAAGVTSAADCIWVYCQFTVSRIAISREG